MPLPAATHPSAPSVTATTRSGAGLADALAADLVAAHPDESALALEVARTVLDDVRRRDGRHTPGLNPQLQHEARRRLSRLLRARLEPR